MFVLFSLKKYQTKHALCVGLAVLSAVLINYYFSYSKEYWIPLSTFLVSQTTRGTPIKQSFNFFLIILIALFLSAFMLQYLNHLEIDIILVVVFISISYIAFIFRPLAIQTQYACLIFTFILLIATLEPIKSNHFMEARIADAAIGAAIGILWGLITYVQPIKAFKQGLVPLVRLLIDYSQVLTNSFLGHTQETERIKTKLAIEDALQNQHSAYPEWVYEVGFNPGLRGGFRFFLITLERVIELFFSMDFLTSYKIDIFGKQDQDIRNLADAIHSAMKKNQELLSILLHYFADNELRKTDSDFTSDITVLENNLRIVVPHTIELLDISPDYLTLTAFVRDIKDMRGLLLQLVMALPAV